MVASSHCSQVLVPRVTSEDQALLVYWLVEDGERVGSGQPIAELETSKVLFEVEAEQDGYLFHLASEGDELPVGAPFALISERPERPQSEIDTFRVASGKDDSEQVISRRARALIEESGLALELFAGRSVVREADVKAVIGQLQPDEEPGPERDPLLDSQDLESFKRLLAKLRSKMKGRYDRHVPVGTLLNDRWELARELGFGEESSVYDECLVLGDVSVGSHCWIGPYTVLDAAHAPLMIGDHTSIGSGSQIYTHNTIERTLTGNRSAVFGKATTIGSCCFIAPLVTVGPGTVIGDHSFVAAGSYVEGIFPAHSYISGNPARLVGRVELEGDRARLCLERDIKFRSSS